MTSRLFDVGNVADDTVEVQGPSADWTVMRTALVDALDATPVEQTGTTAQIACSMEFKSGCVGGSPGCPATSSIHVGPLGICWNAPATAKFY